MNVWRRTVLAVHIVAAGSWIGIDVIVAVLVLTGWFSDDVTVRGIVYQVLARFVVWPMLISGLASLVTGLLLGQGSRWGLMCYWWVAVKLVLNAVLCTLIVVVLEPSMSAPAVSLTSLSLATVLTVFTPGVAETLSRRQAGFRTVPEWRSS